MEYIARERIDPEWAGYPPRLRLPPLIIVMLLGFAVLNMVVRLAAQYPLAPANPFSAYSDIFPGQTVSAVEARNFSCQSNYNYYASPEQHRDFTEETCTLTPAGGVFSSIQVVTSDGIIRQSIFLMRDNTLRFGDVALFLETPAIQDDYRVVFFSSTNGFVLSRTIDHANQFSFFLPVLSISLTGGHGLT